MSGIFQAHINLFNLNSDSEIRLVLAPINRVKKKKKKRKQRQPYSKETVTHPRGQSWRGMGRAPGLGQTSPGNHLPNCPLPTGASLCSPWETASREGVLIHRRGTKEAEGPKTTWLVKGRAGLCNDVCLAPNQVPVIGASKRYVLLPRHSWCFRRIRGSYAYSFDQQTLPFCGFSAGIWGWWIHWAWSPPLWSSF